MFSPFRGRRSDEPGSGGKTPRERRRPSSASPYARPENSQPLPLPPAENPRWLPGIVTRAGRLLSSVFRSDSSETSSSYSSDADGGGHDGSDEEEDADAYTKVHELDETGKSCKSCMAHHEGPEFITQRIERRLAIEKLLLQETFSRDEGERLIKIIQSRVVGATGGYPLTGEREFLEKAAHNDLTPGGAGRLLNRGSKFPERLGYSVNHLSGPSPGKSSFHAYSQDLSEKAVMEAMKWLEKKKMESTSKAELNCGPCVLNTDALQYRMEDEVGSPVDMAKSYMRERPPWQSPILNSIGFNTPPIGVHLFGDATPHTIFSTSKALKRSYHLTTDLDHTRSVRMRSMENPPDSGLVQSSIVISEHETHQKSDGRNVPADGTDQDLVLLSAIETPEQVITSAGIPEMIANEDRVVLNSSDERATQKIKLNLLPSSEMTKAVDSSANVSAKLGVEDDQPDSVSGPKVVQTFEVNHSTNDEVNTESDKMNETCNLVSIDPIPDAEESFDVVNLCDEIEAQTVLPSEKETGMECISSVFDCPDTKQNGAEECFFVDHEQEDTFVTEASKDIALAMEKQHKNVLVRDGFSSQETFVNHNDARDFVESFNAEVLEEMGSHSVKSSSSSNPKPPLSDSKIHVTGAHVDPSAEEEKQDHRSPHSELLASPEVEDIPVDKRYVAVEDHGEKDIIPATGSMPNGDLSLHPGSSSKPYVRQLKKGSRRLPTPTNGRFSAASRHEETGNLSTVDSVDASGDHGTFAVQTPQNGTSMNSIGQMLAEDTPVSRHSRGGRKVAARSRRGRGRGK